MATYIERLNSAIRAKQTPALVGLDPRFDQLPADVLERARQATPNLRQQMAGATRFELQDALLPFGDKLPAGLRGRNERIDELFTQENAK
jgi:hypothetical protein